MVSDRARAVPPREGVRPVLNPDVTRAGCPAVSLASAVRTSPSISLDIASARCSPFTAPAGRWAPWGAGASPDGAEPRVSSGTSASPSDEVHARSWTGSAAAGERQGKCSRCGEVVGVAAVGVGDRIGSRGDPDDRRRSTWCGAGRSSGGGLVTTGSPAARGGGRRGRSRTSRPWSDARPSSRATDRARWERRPTSSR